MDRHELSHNYFYTRRSNDTRFAKIHIGKPAVIRDEPLQLGEDGVWLHLIGIIPNGLTTSPVLVAKQVSAEPLVSLNHAFTKLSEKYEPWRMAKSGSIYQRVLYQEEDGLWYPLGVLRDKAIARYVAART
jgi:hypothetical protein